MTMVLDGSGLTTTGVPNSGTAQNSTSGTSIDFTSIPSGVKRITVMFNGVSMSSSTPYIAIQLGAGSIDSTSYSGSMATVLAANTTSAVNNSTYFTVGSLNAAADTFSGSVTLTLLGSNTWVLNGVMGNSGTRGQLSGGAKTLSGTLDRVRILTSDGSTTFDAGSINILYE